MNGVARVQPEATLHPGKFELFTQWLPDQWWLDGDPSDLEIAAKSWFVDPDNVVGLDYMLVCSTDAIHHTPVTWRPRPLDDDALIGTLQYSELDTRYCCDVQTDPVYLDELVRAVRKKDSDADIVEAGGDTPCPKNVKAFGSGLVVRETSGYPHVVHRLNRASINDVVNQLMGQQRHCGIDRIDPLAVLH